MIRRPSAVSIIAGAVIIAIYAPIATVLVNSFNADERLLEWGGWTLRWYGAVARDAAVREALLNSVAVAVATTTISLVLAILTALWWRQAGSRGRELADGLAYMRIVLPEVVIAIGLLLLLDAVDVPRGFWPVVVGHVVISSAFASIIIQARLRSLDPALEQAAADLGAPPRRVFTRVVLPQLAPAIAVAGLLVFTLSFDNVVISFFLRDPLFQTLPTLLLGEVRLRVSAQANALGAAVMLVTTAAFVLAVCATAFRGGGGLRSLAGGRGDR